MAHPDETGVLGVTRLRSVVAHLDNTLAISNFEGGVLSSTIQQTALTPLLLVHDFCVPK